MISNGISYDCEVYKMKCKNFIMGCVMGCVIGLIMGSIISPIIGRD